MSDAADERFWRVWSDAFDVWQDSELVSEFLHRRHAMLNDRRPQCDPRERCWR